LACNAVYSAANGRVARNFNLGSGDTTCAFGLGLCPEFDYTSYNTRFPVIYKYLNLDEVVFALMAWYYSLVQAAIATLPIGTSTNSFIQPDIMDALVPFTWSDQQFRIMVRQVILYYYANSAALTQFLKYSNAPNAFEPFRCGSNCYPANMDTTMFMPTLLIENLRMLQMRTFTFPQKFFNKKNTQTFVPVWGVYPKSIPPNFFGVFLNNETSTFESFIFTGDSSNDPNIIDGVDSSSNVCDLNNSSFVANMIYEWNARITLLSQLSLPTGQLGGSSNGVLLTTTRYAVYKQEQKTDLTLVSPFVKKRLPKQYIKTSTLTRTLSLKKRLKKKKVILFLIILLFIQSLQLLLVV
jgi:hypothetical protein